jgi:hypothetical protein
MSQHLIYIEADDEASALDAIGHLQSAPGIVFAQAHDFDGVSSVWNRASLAVQERTRESARERRIANLTRLLKQGSTCFASVADGYRDHRCGKPSKGNRTTYDGNVYPVCGIHLRAKYARQIWIG